MTQQSDSKDSSVEELKSLKFSTYVWEWITDFQERERRRRGGRNKVTQDEALRELIELAGRSEQLEETIAKTLASGIPEVDNQNLSPETRELIGLLISVMQSGDKELIEVVSGNINLSYGMLQLKRKRKTTEGDEKPQSTP